MMFHKITTQGKYGKSGFLERFFLIIRAHSTLVICVRWPRGINEDSLSGYMMTSRLVVRLDDDVMSSSHNIYVCQNQNNFSCTSAYIHKQSFSLRKRNATINFHDSFRNVMKYCFYLTYILSRHSSLKIVGLLRILTLGPTLIITRM